jgi:hypothetical protein
MARLHKEFIQFNMELKLTTVRKDGLKNSRKEIKRKIRNWFDENKPDELQPKFAGQGSFEMNTIVNPIPEYENDIILRRYDLDYGIYFIENEGEDNKRAIETWHNWVYEAVEDHTDQAPIKKNTCIRVIFADGHHIDLPIYYQKDGIITLAHKTKDWIESDPKEFYEWFNSEKSAQIERIVRYLKAWKNYRETKNSSLRMPSGFSLTILAVNNYAEYDNDDQSFRETILNLHSELSRTGGFKCLRPTTPVGEDVFQEYSETRKTNFLNALESLLGDMERADEEKNFREASEILRNNQFGSRFPLGEDKDEDKKSATLAAALGAAGIKPKPYGY